MREYFADVVIAEIEEFSPLWNKKVLDVGGASGEFSRVMHQKRQCDVTNVDPDPKDCIWPQTIIGSADALPFGDDEFEVVICRGVLEHIPTERQQKSVDEMYRVTRPGGLCYIMIPPWFNPHAGHGLKPFHVLPFPIAKFLRQTIFRKKIKGNSLEEFQLYPITFRDMSKMNASSGFEALATKDTHFRLHFMTRIPFLREVAVPAVAFILTKT